MRRTIAIACLAAAACTNFDPAESGLDKADVLGADDRQQIDEATDPRVLEWARSTALLATRTRLEPRGDHFFASPKTLGEAALLCDGERFAEEPQLGFCSSFLIGPDVLATAGHCIAATACEDIAVIFDFRRNGASADPSSIPVENVFRCKEVLAREFVNGGDDYAVLRLDRAALGRRPFTLQSEIPAVGTHVGLLGHPSGIWAKIDLSGTVLETASNRIFSSLDSFQGHSGAVVVDLASGNALAVHTTGGAAQYDFESEGCARTASCDGADCVPSGEVSVNSFAALVGSAPTEVSSCEGACGLADLGASTCSCDLACRDRGDCCPNFEPVCGGTSDTPACLDGGGACAIDEDCLAGGCSCGDGTLVTFGTDSLCRDGECRSTVELCDQFCFGLGGIQTVEPSCERP